MTLFILQKQCKVDFTDLTAESGSLIKYFENIMTDGFSNKKEITFVSINLQVSFKLNITVCYLNLHFAGPKQLIKVFYFSQLHTSWDFEHLGYALIKF